MRFYPDIPHRFANRLVSDVLVVAAVVLLALLGLQVRHTVNRLVVVPRGGYTGSVDIAVVSK